MLSDKHNSIMAKATYGLDFFHSSTSFLPERSFWHTAVHAMHSSWTYQCPQLCPMTVKGVNLVVACDGFPL